MKIVVFGAGGKTGREVVNQALQRKWNVRAFVHSPEKFDLTHENLELVGGDATDMLAVDKAIKGTDAVISTLGQWGGADPNLLTKAMINITSNMKNHKVERVISLTGSGVFAPEDKVRIWHKAANAGLMLIAPQILLDGAKHVAVLMSTDLSWTVCRTSNLRNGSMKEIARGGFLGDPLSFYINRSDLAAFMCDQVKNEEFVGKLPIVGY